MAAQRAIARVAYKGLLKAARRLDASGAAAWKGEKSVIGAVGALPAPVATAVAAASGTGAPLVATVRAAFRAGAAAPAPVDSLLDAAIKALSVANKRVASMSAGAGAAGAGAGAATPATASHRMGTVIRHKSLGYKGVIVGWDEVCRASDKWIAATSAARLPHGTAQPFYHVLVDVRDRPGAAIAYVAQDLMQAVAAPADAARADELLVVHPLLTRYFASLDVGAGCYVPSATALAVAATTKARSATMAAASAAAAAARMVMNGGVAAADGELDGASGGDGSIGHDTSDSESEPESDVDADGDAGARGRGRGRGAAAAPLA